MPHPYTDKHIGGLIQIEKGQKIFVNFPLPYIGQSLKPVEENQPIFFETLFATPALLVHILDDKHIYVRLPRFGENQDVNAQIIFE